jgi:hypothetical protein
MAVFLLVAVAARVAALVADLGAGAGAGAGGGLSFTLLLGEGAVLFSALYGFLFPRRGEVGKEGEVEAALLLVRARRAWAQRAWW